MRASSVAVTLPEHAGFQFLPLQAEKLSKMKRLSAERALPVASHNCPLTHEFPDTGVLVQKNGSLLQ